MCQDTVEELVINVEYDAAADEALVTDVEEKCFIDLLFPDSAH